MMHDHTIYGLVIRSDRVLGSLEPAPPGALPDLRVHLGSRPAWAGNEVTRLLHVAETREGETPMVVAEELGVGSGVRLRYDEGIRFHIDASSDDVWTDWDAPLTFDDAMTFLVGPVLGYVLRRRGVLALHASAVVIGDRLVGFVGEGGAGKSTLAATLAARGHAVLTDDVLALREREGRWIASPAHEQVRLWDESARLLFGDASQLPVLSDTWEKRALDLRERGFRFRSEPAMLDALVLLDGFPASGADAALVPAGGSDALLFLVANSYTSYLLDPAARAAELRATGRLLAGVAVASLRRPAGTGGGPGQVAEVVEAWARHLTT